MIKDNIRKKAKEKNMSILTVEKKAGLANGTICKWAHHSPTLSTLYKVAEVLDTSVAELLAEDKNEDKETDK